MGFFSNLFNNKKEETSEEIIETVAGKIEPKNEKPEVDSELSEKKEKKKKKKKGPEKPAGVPAEAVWVKADKEWELGEKNENGKNIGEWKWWLAPNGHLACHSFFDDNGQMLNYTRYHADGTFSQKGTYKNGVLDGKRYAQRSVNETTEIAVPHQAPENIFSIEYDYVAGEITNTKMFDFDNNELDQQGNLLNPKPTGDTPENAIWDSEYQEWELGENKEGERDGSWKSWTPNGIIICDRLYNKGIVLEEKHFFPNGEVSYLVKYNSFGAYSFRHIRSSEEFHNEHFPTGSVDPAIIVLEYTYDARGYMSHWKGTDANGTDIEDNEMYHSLDNRHEQTKYDSLEEASKIWNTDGKEFYKDMSWWLGQYYDENSDVPENEPEPMDERMDMERVVLDALEKFNNEGTPEKGRELFIPSYEPISKYTWDNLGKNIHKIMAIDENNFMSIVNNDLYSISNNKITLEKDLVNFGASRDKKYFAKCYVDKIEVTEGWTGNVVSKHNYPNSYGEEIMAKFPTLTTESFNSYKSLNISEVIVFENGTKVLLVTSEGTYVLSNDQSQILYPEHDKMVDLVSKFNERVNGDLESYLFTINMEYVNADISVNEEFIAIGGKIPAPTHAGSCIYKNVNGQFELVKYSQEDSMFSIQNKFHPNGKDLLHGACMYASIGTNWSQDLANTTFRMNVSDINTGDLELTSFAGGYRQAPGVICSVAPYSDNSFAIGMFDDGYIWVHNDDSSLKGYLYVGGTVSSMDRTPDGKYLIVSTNQGQIVKFKIGDKKGDNLITNLNVVDEKRYLFFNGYQPLVW